jgi:hypothetical protein
VLSDFIAPGRLRDGEPQALAALVAVGGWSVVSYCERAGAGEEVARAVVLAFVRFRRRAIEAADEAAADLERILLESARDSVDELRGEAPAAEQSRAAEDAFARTSPRPLSPRLATQVLRALVEAAPVDGEPAAVRAVAERSYAEAYEAGEPAAAVAGEAGLAPASPLLVRAAQGGAAAAAPPRAPQAAPPSGDSARAPAQAPAGGAAVPPLRQRMSVPPVWRAVGGAALLIALIVLITGGDDAPPTTAPAARTVTVTATGGAGTSGPPVARGLPREPVTASGARFEVAPIRKAIWARQIRKGQTRRGYRWVTISVRARNLTRHSLTVSGLGYRLLTRPGVIVGPAVVDLAAATAGVHRGRLAVDAQASVHLGFEVPADARRGLTFAFEPGGLDEPTVVVPLPDQS